MQNLYMQNNNHLSKWNTKSHLINNVQYIMDTTGCKIEAQTSPQAPITDFSTLTTTTNPSFNKFQYVLIAPTSPAVKINEDTLTYLNQGQNYELKLSRTSPQIQMGQSPFLEDIKPHSLEQKLDRDNFKDILIENTENTLNHIVCQDSNQIDKMLFQELNDRSTTNLSLGASTQSPDTVYMSVIRLCFWDRKLQEIEQEEIKEWEKEYNNVRMLEIDNTSSFGIIDVRLSDMFTNAAEVLWYGKTGASLFFRCNCTSTAFAPHKHGGEKGIHMRFQIDTFEMGTQMTSKWKFS